jgi:hypothetical protein
MEFVRRNSIKIPKSMRQKNQYAHRIQNLSVHRKKDVLIWMVVWNLQLVRVTWMVNWVCANQYQLSVLLMVRSVWRRVHVQITKPQYHVHKIQLGTIVFGMEVSVDRQSIVQSYQNICLQIKHVEQSIQIVQQLQMGVVKWVDGVVWIRRVKYHVYGIDSWKLDVLGVV